MKDLKLKSKPRKFFSVFLLNIQLLGYDFFRISKDEVEPMLFFNLSFLAFIFFLIYDLNAVKFKKNLLNYSAGVGAILLGLACMGAIKYSLIDESISLTRTILASSSGLAFLWLMVETLVGKSPKEDGMYKMCRHPELIWFLGFYLSIFWAVGGDLIMTLGEFSIVLVGIFSYFREKKVYPILLGDYYQEYKSEVPYVIPNRESIMNAFTKNEKINKNRKIININFGGK